MSPAFVNLHTHLALGFLRGVDLRQAARGNMVEDYFFRVEAHMTPADVRAFARMGAYDSLLSGVGLVWDHYYAAVEVAEAIAEVGLTAVVAPTLQDLAGPGVAALEEQLAATAHIDDVLGARGVFAALGPHASDTVSHTLLGRAADLAEARDLPLHMHLGQSLEEYERAFERHGVSPVRAVLDHVDGGRAVFAHCLYAGAADLEALAAARACLVLCPHSQLVFGFPASLRDWLLHGVEWAVATDCASNNDAMNVQQELRFVAGQRTAATCWSESFRALQEHPGVAAARAVWQARNDTAAELAALGEPANLLARIWSIPGARHPKVRAGVIEPGALANLVVWDLDHPALWPALDPLHVLCMADAAPAIWAMVVHGRDVGTPGDFHQSILCSPELHDARREAGERLQALQRRVV